MTRIEMCFWNEADGKHKLFAYNHMKWNGHGFLAPSL